MHDEQREEIEIKYDRKDFEKMEHLLNAIGFNVEIKWFRKRKNFKWNEITVTVDYTKGYGYILEFEMMSSEDEKEKSLNFLKQKLKELGVEQTPLEDFNKAFDYYKNNWKELTK
jgi:predicted adenylyl cyclase CyaB